MNENEIMGYKQLIEVFYPKHAEFLDDNFMTACEAEKNVPSRYTEIFTAEILSRQNITLKRGQFEKNKAAPDFYFFHNQYKIVIECVTPSNFLKATHNKTSLRSSHEAFVPDYEKIRLMICSSINEKLNRENSQYRRCIANGSIKNDDIFILHIGLFGISKLELLGFCDFIEALPYPWQLLGAFFSVGVPEVVLPYPYEDTADKIVNSNVIRLAFKPNNFKRVSDSDVRAINPVFEDKDPIKKSLSAVLISGHSYCNGLLNDMILIHNPKANMPLPYHTINVLKEYASNENELWEV